MKKGFVFTLISFLGFAVNAQYYYQDIIGTNDLNHMVRTYLDNKVTKVEAAGTNPQGMKDADFSETHTVDAGQRVMKIATRNKTNIDNEYYRFNEKGLVTGITDTAGSVVSMTSFDYGGTGQLEKVMNRINDANDSLSGNEVHEWIYGSNGKPEKMLRIVNGKDTSEIHFKADEKGNVIEELPVIRGVPGETIHYFYDDSSRLTDIVRYNTKAKRLLPDYMFEYTEGNQLAQKITTLSAGGAGYLIWRYAYDSKGLKTTEASFSRNKQLTGKIRYSYQFGN